ncbi:MAG: ABC transporter permease [Candidatus Dormibacter sp.]|uniref:ABC transporter permease n=1 Tax=Candidatus Dormibacter sp. TaxID=2973982 RepID=UPI0026C32D0C
MSAVLLFLVIVFSAIRPDAFPSLANAQNVVMDAAALLVMAVGMTYVMIAAGIDLSVGSVLVFAGVCSAKVMGAMGADNWGTVLAGLVVALAAGLAWGLFNGLCITKLRVPALITTLGTLGAALGAANLVTHGNDVRTVPLTLIEFGVGGPLGLSWIVWVAIAVAIVGGLVLARTRFGRHTYIIGSNAEAGRRAGINVDNHLLKLYGLSGLLAGLAGWLSLARFATTTIAGHSTDVLAVITGVVLGGTSLFGGFGTVGGTVIGILIPTALSNGFIIVNVEPFWQEVATGFILIAAVYVDQIKRRARERA